MHKIDNTIYLKGMTWDNERGYNPMLVTSNLFCEEKLKKDNQNIVITWEKRSLQAFADKPIEDMIKEYDLIVIDHPHAGKIASEKLLINFDGKGHDEKLKMLKEESVGASFRSYEFDNHQWALPIDTASPISIYREDLLKDIPKTWSDVVELAKKGKVIWPLIPINALMSYYNFLGNINEPFGENNVGVKEKTSIAVLKMMKEVSDNIPKECFNMDPIDAYEWLSTRSSHSYVPYAYGYSNYSKNDFRPHIVKVTNIPSIKSDKPIGSPLGGTGIAISKYCKNLDIALEYSFYIASAEIQKTSYFDAFGQPANIKAWESKYCNEKSGNYFKDTLETLKLSYVRPQHMGYMEFQEIAGNIIFDCLNGKLSEEEATMQINNSYKKSLDHV